MKTPPLRQQVRDYLAQYFIADEPLSDDECLVDHLGADSLDLLQVASTLNEMFGIDIDTDALPEMLTVGGVCDLVERLYSEVSVNQSAETTFGQ